VAVAKVAAQKLAKTIHLAGELSAYRNVGLYAKVQGFIEQIRVDRGSAVEQGQLLVKLTAPEIEAQCREQAAKLAADELTYKRVKEAARTPGVVAGNDIQIAGKTVEADRARLAACAQNEAYLRIDAPFAGVITERNVHEGSTVGPNPVNAPPMLRIQEIARLRLVVSVPEMAVGTIPAGNKVKFTVAAYPGEIFSGTVAREAFSVDPKTRTMPVELDVENAERRLTPGMFAQVRWEISRQTPSLFVPSSAVVTTTERKFVIRIRDVTAEWIDVEVGQQMAGVIEVFGELVAGDLVAIRGTDEIRSGLAVFPKEAS
jgi:membrane fusion protein (multidrug efflux system)